MMYIHARDLSEKARQAIAQAINERYSGIVATVEPIGDVCISTDLPHAANSLVVARIEGNAAARALRIYEACN